MIDEGIGLRVALWQPLVEKSIGQDISGIACETGGIEWSFGRTRGLEL